MSTERVVTTSMLPSARAASSCAGALTNVQRSETPSASAVSPKKASRSCEMSEKTTCRAPRSSAPKPINPSPQPTSSKISPAANAARSSTLSRTTARCPSISRRTSASPPERCSASHSAQMSRRRFVPGLALGAFGRRGLHGRAGERERARLGLGQALRLFSRGLGLRLLVLGEDLLFRRAGEQSLELVLVDRLPLDQDPRDLVQLGHVLLEDGDGELVRLLDHALDLIVDLAGDLLRVVRLSAHLAAQERHVVVAAEHARPELVAHPVAHDHLLRDRRDLLEVVRGAGRDLVEHKLPRGTAAQGHCQLLHQCGLRRQVTILAAQRYRLGNL